MCLTKKCLSIPYEIYVESAWIFTIFQRKSTWNSTLGHSSNKCSVGCNHFLVCQHQSIDKMKIDLTPILFTMRHEKKWCVSFAHLGTPARKNHPILYLCQYGQEHSRTYCASEWTRASPLDWHGHQHFPSETAWTLQCGARQRITLIMVTNTETHISDKETGMVCMVRFTNNTCPAWHVRIMVTISIHWSTEHNWKRTRYNGYGHKILDGSQGLPSTFRDTTWASRDCILIFSVTDMSGSVNILQIMYSSCSNKKIHKGQLSHLAMDRGRGQHISRRSRTAIGVCNFDYVDHWTIPRTTFPSNIHSEWLYSGGSHLRALEDFAIIMVPQSMLSISCICNLFQRCIPEIEHPYGYGIFTGIPHAHDNSTDSVISKDMDLENIRGWYDDPLELEVPKIWLESVLKHSTFNTQVYILDNLKYCFTFP